MLQALAARDSSDTWDLIESWAPAEPADPEPAPVTQTASSVMAQMMTGGHKVTTRVVTR